MSVRRPLAAQPWFAPVVAPLVVGVCVVAIWQWSCEHWAVPPYLFPSPRDIARAFLAGWPGLLTALWSTLRVTLVAFALSVVIGTGIAFLFVQSRVIELGFLPYAVLLQVTPIVAVAPLIIILVKNTPVALTLCATVIAIFPIISNTTIGLRSVDPGLLAYFRMNKASRLDTLLRLRVPSALPLFLAHPRRGGGDTGLHLTSGAHLAGR